MTTTGHATWHDYTFDRDYDRGWMRTSDPRVLAVMETDRSMDFHPVSSDAYAPAFYVDRHGVFAAGETFHDPEAEDLAKRYLEARDRFRYAAGYRYDGLRADVDARAERMLARWLRIFHDTEAAEAGHDGQDVLILSTPAWREALEVKEVNGWRVTSVTSPGQGFAETRHDGVTALAARIDHLAAHPDEGRGITSVTALSTLDGDVETWNAYLAGDVYGVGYAVRPEGQEFPIGDDVDLDNLDVFVESWGYIGDDFAAEVALEVAEDHASTLPQMLAIP